MAGFWEYFDKRNQRAVEFENERHRRRLGSTAADIWLAGFVAMVLRLLAQGLTDGRLEAVLRALIVSTWLILAVVLTVRALIRYRRDKRAWKTEHPITP